MRGLNTAATLWCSASIGVLSGVGAISYAALVTGLVIFVNLLLRPLVYRIDRQPLSSSELESAYAVSIVCRGDREAHMRALLLQRLAASAMHLRRLDSRNIEDSDRVEIEATVHADTRSDRLIEQIVGRLSLEPSVTAARWRVETLSE